MSVPDIGPLPSNARFVPEIIEMSEATTERLARNIRRYVDIKFKAQSYLTISIVFALGCIAALAVFLARLNTGKITGFGNLEWLALFVIVAGFVLAAVSLISSYRFIHITRYEKSVAKNTAYTLKYLLDHLHRTEERNNLKDIEAFRLRIVISELELALTEFERQVFDPRWSD